MDILGTLSTTYRNISHLTLYNMFKTGNPIYDAIISTVLIAAYGYIFNYISNYSPTDLLSKLNMDNVKSLFFHKNSITIEGRNTLTACAFTRPSMSSMFSTRFKAMSNHIISNLDTYKDVRNLKEAHSSRNGMSEPESDIFMVHQNRSFTLDKYIYARVTTEEEQTNDDKEKAMIKTDKMTILIYSYVYTIKYITKYVDDITQKYMESVKESRSNKRFIYSLHSVNQQADENILSCWREDVFDSARTFQNMFFDGKQELVSQIDHFLQNRDWYFEKGIPYSLGIGLHGPPGTGKTSFIKALAKYTKRNLVVIPLKIIKTKKQLESFFFENTYSHNNQSGTVSFDKKIIVFEDIDCIGDVVLDRKNKDPIAATVDKGSTSETTKLCEIMQSICETNELNTVKMPTIRLEEPITLDDILNLWDGIRETPGRILVISSNHYRKLDPALTRPGRIDITHELSNASHKTIAEMYHHLFGSNISTTKLKRIQEYLYSPAELINFYVQYKNEHDFVKRLTENKKIM